MSRVFEATHIWEAGKASVSLIFYFQFHLLIRRPLAFPESLIITYLAGSAYIKFNLNRTNQDIRIWTGWKKTGRKQPLLVVLPQWSVLGKLVSCSLQLRIYSRIAYIVKSGDEEPEVTFSKNDSWCHLIFNRNQRRRSKTYQHPRTIRGSKLRKLQMENTPSKLSAKSMRLL